MEPIKPHSSATAYRRQMQIEDCLYENMLRTPYASISVADLCRQVGISRKAFYNYYRDKQSCLGAILNRKVHECMLLISTTVPDDEPLQSAIVMLDYWKSQKTIFDILVRNNLLQFLMTQSIEYILEQDRSVLTLLNIPEVQSDTDILACYIGSQMTLLLQWYLRGFDTPIEEMARKYLRITRYPMISTSEA